MRIALFHNLPSGGAKRSVYETVKRMALAHHIDAYTLSCANHIFADLRPHVADYHVFNFNPLPLFSSPFGRLNQVFRLTDLLRLNFISRTIARKIRQGNYDIILVHPCQFEQCPTILTHLQDLPSVYYCHEPLRLLYENMPSRPYERNTSYSWHRILDRIDPFPALYHFTLEFTDQRNIHHANTVLVNSEFVRIAVSHIYLVEAQVSYPGVDPQRFRPLPIEKEPMVLSVGSLTPLKGFDFLIQALAQIPNGQRPTLVIASNSQNLPERAYLGKLALDLKVDLQLMDKVSDERLARLYNQAKVTVYSPVREPFGLVPLESMACGTPVIAVREGGTQETIINEHTGLLIERDPDQFAVAIQRLLSNPDLASEYGHNGREHVLCNWTWDRSVESLEKHLIDCSSNN